MALINYNGSYNGPSDFSLSGKQSYLPPPGKSSNSSSPSKPLEASLPRATVDRPGEWDSIVDKYVKLSKEIISNQKLSPIEGIKQLKELKACCVPVYRQFDVQDITDFSARIDLAALAVLKLSYQDIGEDQVVELLSKLPNYLDRKDLEFATLLWGKHRTARVLEAFAGWLDRSQDFKSLYQLKDWPWQDIVRLVPYLTKIHFLGIPSEAIEKLIYAAADSPTVKKMTFFTGNTIDEKIAKALASCHHLEELAIEGSTFAEDVKIPFNALPNLRRLEISNAKNFKQDVDLRKGYKLVSMKIKSCDEFNGQILFPKASALESFYIGFCRLWNQALDFSSCQQLKKLTIDLSRAWNKPLDLRSLASLEELEMQPGNEWNAPLLLPESSDNKLRKALINDCQKYNQTISFKSNLKLKEVNLAGCHLLNQPFEFDQKVELDVLNLQNCLAWNQAIPHVKAIERLVIKNCKAFKQEIPKWVKTVES